MTDIAVYVEGGGDNKDQKAALRRGFDALFKDEKSRARNKQSSLSFICCGGRREAYEAFLNELDSNPTRISALLVDSESPVVSSSAGRLQDGQVRIEHLKQRQGDGWELSDELADRIHLMVQCMEAWIVADPDTLAKFYGQEFKRAKLPERLNLEEEPKGVIYKKLDSATRDTKKGSYAKIRHASELLSKIDPEKVSARCVRFSFFREWLAQTIGS